TSYHIEATEERTTSQEFEHSWNKTILSAAEASGNRYHFQSRSNIGSFLLVSDGKTEWVYEVEAHSYTQKPMSPVGPASLRRRCRSTGERTSRENCVNCWRV